MGRENPKQTLYIARFCNSATILELEIKMLGGKKNPFGRSIPKYIKSPSFIALLTCAISTFLICALNQALPSYSSRFPTTLQRAGSHSPRLLSAFFLLASGSAASTCLSIQQNHRLLDLERSFGENHLNSTGLKCQLVDWQQLCSVNDIKRYHLLSVQYTPGTKLSAFF